MPRKVAFSAKQKREQLKLKRAIKRGDVDPPPTTPHSGRKFRPKGRTRPRDTTAAESSRKLQSSFVKLPKAFLEVTRSLSATISLQRPIQSEAALWADAPPHANVNDGDTKPQQLACPRRPKWRYEMSKNEVEKNEEGHFKKWINQTDALVDAWCTPATPDTTDTSEDETEKMPRAPTSFERNLEVWRQLWRVTEISQIILILLDSRCPLLHYPPSLESYLSSPHLSSKRTILVLTKVDISGPARAEAWTQYLRQKYPHLRIVQVEAYAEKDATAAQQVHAPHIPSVFRERLVNALKDTHAELLQPPGKANSSSESLASWRPSVRREVNWDAVLQARGDRVGQAVGGVAVPKAGGSNEHEEVEVAEGYKHDEDGDAEPEFLTIGIIGQPNVGKSSLLNALFGTQKVSASKTPGKTKHFQTLFWTPEVRLVDCPGLVMPNLVPMETQESARYCSVLSGILPISRVSAAALCVHHAAQLLPLERVFDLTHPASSTDTAPDKRTWREPRTVAQVQQSLANKAPPPWTAMDILTALALKKGWLTARLGRPDINRAGNFILRMLAEGRIRWAFWPPGTSIEIVEAHNEPGAGLWIPSQGTEDDFDFSESENEADHSTGTSGELSHSEESDGEADFDDMSHDEEDENVLVSGGAGRFAALQLGAEDDGTVDNNKDI